MCSIESDWSFDAFSHIWAYFTTLLCMPRFLYVLCLFYPTSCSDSLPNELILWIAFELCFTDIVLAWILVVVGVSITPSSAPSSRASPSCNSTSWVILILAALMRLWYFLICGGAGFLFCNCYSHFYLWYFWTTVNNRSWLFVQGLMLY